MNVPSHKLRLLLTSAILVFGTSPSGLFGAIVYTLQQGLDGYAGAVENTLRSATPTSNNQVTTTEVLGQTNGPNMIRALYSFDLSSIPDGTTFDDVSFSFRTNQDTGSAPAVTKTIGLYVLTQPFTSTGATWNNAAAGTPWTTPGGDFDPTPLATQAGIAFSGIETASGTNLWTFSGASLTSAVQTAFASGSQTFYFIAKLTNDAPDGNRNIFQINALQSATQSNRPALTVTAAPIPEPSTLLLLGLAGVTCYARIRHRRAS